jgi:hypothetical protein
MLELPYDRRERCRKKQEDGGQNIMRVFFVPFVIFVVY